MHIIISFFAMFFMYVGSMFCLARVEYKQKPLVYITNNYYCWKGGDTYEKFFEFSEKRKYDVLFAGSSRSYRGYSPFVFESYGYNCFNLGTSAQSIKNTYFIIKHFVNQNTCKLLVIDVFAGAFTGNQLESSSDLVENISKPLAAYDIAANNKDIRMINIFLLRMLTESMKAFFKEDDYVGKGFSVTKDSLDPVLQEKIEMNICYPQKEYMADKEQLSYLGKIIDFCAIKKINTVFVYSPVSYFYDYSIHETFLKEITPVFKKHRIPFYDFSKCDSINMLFHFYDESHLNQAGVEVFNKLLVKQLEKDRILSFNEQN